MFIPIDELLGYIVDTHFEDPADRRRLHAAIREARQNWGQLGRDYEATLGRAGKLYLVCQNPECRAILGTEHTAIAGQVIECPPCDVTCPACGQRNVYDGADLRLKLD